MAVQRVVASIMLLAFSGIYLGTMVLGNHAKSEILVTVDAFVCVICALNIDNIMAVGRLMPAAATCAWTIFFMFQFYAVYNIATTEDVEKTTVTKVWFIMDVIVAILCFVVVLTHCVLICVGGGGGGGSGRGSKSGRRVLGGGADSSSDYVAIRVGGNRRTTSKIPLRSAGPPRSMPRASRPSVGKTLRSALPKGLAF